MFAVIKTGGKQYIAAPGKKLKVEKLAQEEGEEVVFDSVLLVSDKDAINLGTPHVEGARVTGEVVAHDRHDKVITMKYKAKKRYKKKKGHKQPYTEVLIKEISTSEKPSNKSQDPTKVKD